MRRVIAVTAAVTLWSRGAAADAVFPTVTRIAFSPGDPNAIVAGATFGTLVSRDGGRTWRLLCKAALGLPGPFSDPQVPRLALTTSDALLAGGFDVSKTFRDAEGGLDEQESLVGLDISEDFGCGWSCIGGPLAGQLIADIAVRPELPHHVLALTSNIGASLDAGLVSQVFESANDGATWATVGPPIDPTVTTTGMGIASGDPSRVYVSGTRGYGTAATASLFVLSGGDTGAAWVEHPVPQFNPCMDSSSTMCPNEVSLLVAGVDPNDEDRVYLRSSVVQPGESRLYVTTDRGQTFRVVQSLAIPGSPPDYELPQMLAFAMLPDGSKVFTGTSATGLWRASRSDLTFTSLNSMIPVQCLATRQEASGPELWACSLNARPGFTIGKSTDNGATFTPMMATVTSMAGVVDCASDAPGSVACFASSSASQCGCTEYQQFCTDIGGEIACQSCGFDAAAPTGDAGLEGGSAPKASAGSPSSSGCGCSAAGGGGVAGFAAAFAGAATLLRRRLGAKGRRGPLR